MFFGDANVNTVAMSFACVHTQAKTQSILSAYYEDRCECHVDRKPPSRSNVRFERMVRSKEAREVECGTGALTLLRFTWHATKPLLLCVKVDRHQELHELLD